MPASGSASPESRFHSIDLDHVIEEIESLGREQLHAVESHGRMLREHLLKLDGSNDPDPGRGWKRAILAKRQQLKRRLNLNPSIRARFAGIGEARGTEAVELAKQGARPDEEAGIDALPRYAPEKPVDDGYSGEREAAA